MLSTKRSLPFYFLLGFLILFCTALIEHQMGRLLISKSGQIHFFAPNPDSSENSQQIADWYSFSHIIHGFLLYLFFHLLSKLRPLSIGLRLTLTTLLEASWEILENSPIIINRYRAETISLDYSGDTILNSMCDILFCLIGFAVARRLPVWVTITLIIAMELGVAYAIRDNLTLNIIMLLYPSEAIKHWQMARPH